MKHKSLFIIFLSMQLSSYSYAFFCPSNFAQIDYGMTIAQVEQACGKPDAKNESTKDNENVPQEWNYFINQAASNNVNIYQPAPGTLKSSFMFNAEGKLINISVNGLSVGTTPLCGNRPLSLGNTKDQVKAACGDPAFKSKQGDTNPAANGIKVVEYIYSKANPPATLIFENGIFTGKK